MWTTTTMNVSKWIQCSQCPTLSANQFPSCLANYNWCITSVFATAVYGLVNASRRLCRRLANDLRSMGGEESVMEPFLWTCGKNNGVILALCSVYVDVFVLACRDSTFGKQVFEGINNKYEWNTWESRVFTQSGARITRKPTTNAPKHWMDVRSVQQNT